MIKKFIPIFIIIVFFNVLNTYSIESPIDDNYLIGENPDAAAAGRGYAYGATKGSPFSPYWNPAGLSRLKTNKFGISADVFIETDIDKEIIKETLPLEGNKIDYISIVGPQVGIFWRPITKRTVGATNSDMYLDAKINQYGLTVGVEHSDVTDFGMNINYYTGMIGYYTNDNINTDIYISDGSGWGLDWGLLYTVSPKLNLGLTLLNAPAYIYWEDFDRNKFPPTLRFSVDLRMTALMSFGFDYEKLYSESLTETKIMKLGIEHYLGGSVIARAGAFSPDFDDKKRTTYTTGIGYVKESYTLDISCIQYYGGNALDEIVRRYSVSGIIPF